IQWFPGDAGLFTILTDSKVTLWDTESLSNVYSFPVADLIDHQWSEMGLIAASSREIMLLDPQSGAGTHTLKGHNGGTLGLKWSPAREFILASCGGDGWIKLWDIRKSYEPLAQFQHGQGSCNGIVFSSDGISLFSTGEDERLHCWNVFNQRPRDVTFAPHFKNRGQKKKMVVLESNLEPTLLFYPTQNQILAYNYMTGLLEYRLKGHLGNV
ncbi:WD40-repeat-containing domain protein, partial [Gorgonomyces haynaldii]